MNGKFMMKREKTAERERVDLPPPHQQPAIFRDLRSES